MADNGTIPDRLVAEILRRSGERQSSRDIATWLASEGVECSHHTVNRLIRSHRAERQETARAVVAEKLGSPEGLSADIDGIIALRAEAAEVRALALANVQHFTDAKTVGAWAMAAREYREVTKLALEIAGLSKPDNESAIDDTANEVVGRIAGLLREAESDPSEPQQD